MKRLLRGLIVCALPVWLSAQALPPLKAVVILGSTRYQQAELEKASGLQLGATPTVAILQEADTRLRATGLFTDVTFHYNYSGDGTTVQYQVSDVPTLLPLAFDNFVWMPQDSLVELLKTKVPLFTGSLPATGGVDDQVAAALDAVLAQRGLMGARVEGMPYKEDLGAPNFSNYMYFVRGVKIPVQGIEFSGASPAFLTLLSKDAVQMLGRDYSRDTLSGFIRRPLLREYEDRGYLQAVFGDPVVVPEAVATDGVKLRLDVSEGGLFHWAAITYKGNVAVEGVQLTKLMQSHVGDIADQSTLDSDMFALQSHYQHAGYMDADVTQQVDESQPGAARAVMVIREGPLYRMGTLTFAGVGGDAAASLAKLWTLAPGQPFDGNYLGKYMGAIYGKFDLRGVKLVPTLTQDREHHVVNVRISLARG